MPIAVPAVLYWACAAGIVGMNLKLLYDAIFGA